MPMGFEVTKQMIKDDADINFQLIVHAGDIAYGGVSHEWEFEVRPAPSKQ
jgi:predicted phosphodiesterase